MDSTKNFTAEESNQERRIDGVSKKAFSNSRKNEALFFHRQRRSAIGTYAVLICGCGRNAKRRYWPIAQSGKLREIRDFLLADPPELFLILEEGGGQTR